MTVILVKHDKTSSVRSSEHVLGDKKVTRNHTLRWRVETDTILDGSQTVLLSPAVAHLLDAHPDDPAALANRVRVSQRSENGRIWNLDVDYSTDAKSDQPDDDPLLEEREVSWASATVSAVAAKDRDGKAILNSAGDPFDPPIEVERPHAKLTVARNEASFSGTTAIAYIQKVNSTQFSGGAPGTVLCMDINANEQERNKIKFWRVTYEFEYAPEGWQPDILEQGLRQLVSGNVETCKDNDGEAVTTPVPLDSAGAQIDASTLPGTAVFTTFNVYKEIDFNQLGLNV